MTSRPTEGGSGAAARATQSELGTVSAIGTRYLVVTQVDSDRLFKSFQRTYDAHVEAKESWGTLACEPDCRYCLEFRVVTEWRTAWEDRYGGA